MLRIALYEIQTAHASPAQWARDASDRRCLQWLGLGIAPSRNRWYIFRDRLGPLLETLNRQVLEWAVAQGLTTASRGSLDGTMIAANASRHRLLNLARLKRRLEELDRVIAADARNIVARNAGWRIARITAEAVRLSRRSVLAGASAAPPPQQAAAL